MNSEDRKKYWNSITDTPRQLIGVHPMGRCGLTEVFYRHYWEVRHLKKKVEFNKDKRVLEFGCGTGRWVLSLAPITKHYTGVDFSRSSIKIAQKDVYKNELNNVALHELSIVEFPINQWFDIVYFSGVTQYLEDNEIHAILKKLSPYLKLGAVIIDRSTINYKERELFSQKKYHSIFRTPKEIDAIFSSYGFRLCYRKRSYRFLRGRFLFNSRLLKTISPYLIQLFKPFSFVLLWYFSVIADTIHPIPFEGGDRSHDFFIFTKDTAV